MPFLLTDHHACYIVLYQKPNFLLGISVILWFLSTFLLLEQKFSFHNVLLWKCCFQNLGRCDTFKIWNWLELKLLHLKTQLQLESEQTIQSPHWTAFAILVVSLTDKRQCRLNCGVCIVLKNGAYAPVGSFDISALWTSTYVSAWTWALASQ